MLHTAKNTLDKMLVDEMGRVVPHVHSFDDETNEVEIFIPTNTKSMVVEDGKMKKVKFILKNAKLVEKTKL